MNVWVDATEKLPPLTQVAEEGTGFSDQVVIWMLTEGDDLDNGILSVAQYHYNGDESGWLGDEDLSCWEITHWIEIKRPGEDTGYTLYFNSPEERTEAEKELKRAGINYWNVKDNWDGSSRLTVQSADADKAVCELSEAI